MKMLLLGKNKTNRESADLNTQKEGKIAEILDPKINVRVVISNCTVEELKPVMTISST